MLQACIRKTKKFTMESYAYLIFSFSLLIFIPSLLQLVTYTKKKKLPPGPAGVPIIGNLLTIGDRPHESLTKLAKIYGPLMTVQLGFNTTVVASSTEMAKEILQKNDQACLGRPIPHAVTAEKNYDISIAWLSGGPKWRTLRKLCNSQIFTTQRLDMMQGLRHQMRDKMVKLVKEASEAGEGINIGRSVFQTTMNILSNSMFSIDVTANDSNAAEELKILIAKIMELAGKPNVSDYFPFLRPFDLQGIKRTIKVSYDRLHDLVDEVIQQRMKRRASGLARFDDFLDVLLDHSKKQGAEELNLDDINILFADLFIGGTDTTTTTMEWAMSELIRNPKIMAKAKQELIEKIGLGKSIEENDIPRLPYLQCIIKETMRLHPTVPLLLPHRTEIDVKISRYIIPKHTQLFVNAWALARDPEFWEKPTEFIPERFMGSEIDFRGTNFFFVPFSAGRRICPGIGLGVRMMSLLLASLIHGFEWRLPGGMTPEDMDMNDKFGITLQKAIPLVAIPVLVETAPK